MFVLEQYWDNPSYQLMSLSLPALPTDPILSRQQPFSIDQTSHFTNFLAKGLQDPCFPNREKLQHPCLAVQGFWVKFSSREGPWCYHTASACSEQCHSTPGGRVRLWGCCSIFSHMFSPCMSPASAHKSLTEGVNWSPDMGLSSR